LSPRFVTKVAKKHNALCDSGTLSNTHTQSPATHTHTHTHLAGQSAL